MIAAHNQSLFFGIERQQMNVITTGRIGRFTTVTTTHSVFGQKLFHTCHLKIQNLYQLPMHFQCS